jgi:Domain of unknown function (DUF4124)
VQQIGAFSCGAFLVTEFYGPGMADRRYFRDAGGILIMLRTVAISSLLCVGAVSVANADVYRWVDEHGGVHYSDRWVPGSEVIKSTKSHPTTTASANTTPHHALETPSTAPPASTVDQNAAKAMKQDLSKVREQQCKDLKEKYDKALEARRIYKASGDKPKDIDGNEQREYLSDEEADAYRVKLREQMQDACGNSGK